ncbi:MAG: hypothetical protein AABY22_12220 [Nanoarchaeota archaeon]
MFGSLGIIREEKMKLNVILFLTLGLMLARILRDSLLWGRVYPKIERRFLK